MKRVILLLLVCLVFSTVFVGCGGKWDVIGTWEYWTDKEYHDSDGNPVRTGCRVEITEFDFDKGVIEGRAYIYSPNIWWTGTTQSEYSELLSEQYISCQDNEMRTSFRSNQGYLTITKEGIHVHYDSIIGETLDGDLVRVE